MGPCRSEGVVALCPEGISVWLWCCSPFKGRDQMPAAQGDELGDYLEGEAVALAMSALCH